MRNLGALFVREDALNLRQFQAEEEKLISTIYYNVSKILQEPLRSELFQKATCGLRGSSKHKQWRPGRLVESTTNPHVEIGLQYLVDITFKSNRIDIVQIQTALYTYLDTLGNLIHS